MSLTSKVFDSPDGTFWHPHARLFGQDTRLMIPTVVTSLVVYLAHFVITRIHKAQVEAPVAVLHPLPPQISKGWKGKELESTALLSPTDKEASQIRSFDPSTGWHIATLEADTQSTIDTKLDLATSASLVWKESPWPIRRRVLKSILEWIIADEETIVRIACRDTGKTAVDAYFGEILTTSAKLKYLIANAEKVLSPESRPNGNLLIAHKVSRVYYKPFGVVLASVSWNYPFHNILGPIVAALASGNAIVIKPSEQVAFSTTYYIQCLHRILEKLNLPTSLITLVLVHPSLAPYLTRHPKIKHITFIGSEGVGRKVMVDAAVNLTPVCLELGGKDPLVLLKGTKLKSCVSVFLRAVYQGAGQNCIGIERFIVHQSLVQELLGTILPRVKKLRCGSWMEETPKGRLQGRVKSKTPDPSEGIDFGAMINDASFDKLETLIQDAVKQGAILHTGGSRFTHPNWPLGSYFQPTVLSNVSPEMAIAQQEVFAPIFLILSFEDVREAIKMANGVRMALGSSVFGDRFSEVQYVKNRMEAGMVNINDFGVSYLNQSLPFGGIKAAGFGRFAGPEGLRSLCYPQAVVEDRLFTSMRTSIPRPVDYPIPDSYGSVEFTAGLHRFAFAPDWKTSILGLWDVVREAAGW